LGTRYLKPEQNFGKTKSDWQQGISFTTKNGNIAFMENDIDDTTSPFEVRLGWITKFTKISLILKHLKKEKKHGLGRKLFLSN